MPADPAPFRKMAQALFAAAIDRANPEQAICKALQDTSVTIPAGGRILLVSLGKAAIPMARAAIDLLPVKPALALIVTNPENAAALPGTTVLTGTHPVPDKKSAEAGACIGDLLSSATENDHVVALISGGGSALAVAPLPGLTLADKIDVNRQLLDSGLDITEMNIVRQQLSDLKGGGWLRRAAPARVTAFILSDVIGNDLRFIASGPTTAPAGTAADARKVLERAGIWESIPPRVKTVLCTDGSASQPATVATNILIGSNRHSLDAMSEAVPAGVAASILSDNLTSDVADAAERIVNAAQNWDGPRPAALIFGGETTVRLHGKGLGGRNQELALRVALAAHDRLPPGWVFLSGGTDGRDGPTDAAGGLVDGGTSERIRAAGGDPDALLAENDSHTALKLAGDLVITGGTGTNVADVQVLLLPPVS